MQFQAAGRAHPPVRVRSIVLALILACIAGVFGGKEAALFGLKLHTFYTLIGDVFLQALKMLVVPLVMSALISTLGALGRHPNLGTMGVKTLLYYLFTSRLANII